MNTTNRLIGLMAGSSSGRFPGWARNGASAKTMNALPVPRRRLFISWGSDFFLLVWHQIRGCLTNWPECGTFVLDQGEQGTGWSDKAQ
jgi:hypothetical protein